MNLKILKNFAPEVWIAERRHRALGMELGVRMTVIRLQEWGLFIHSPVSFDQDLKNEIDFLGPVRFIVGPNLFHHLSLRPWSQSYPKAKLLGAPGLPEKRKNLKFGGSLSDTSPPEWEGEIKQVVVKGVPRVNEVVFFHPNTRTLILTDLAFHIQNDSPFFTRMVFFFLNGSYGRMAPTRLFRAVIKDRAAFRRSLDRILEWDFDKIILSHGHVIHQGGREAFRRAFEKFR